MNRTPTAFEKWLPQALLAVAAICFLGANKAAQTLQEHPELGQYLSAIGLDPSLLPDLAGAVSTALGGILLHKNTEKAEQAPARPPESGLPPAQAVPLQIKHSLAGVAQLAMEQGNTDLVKALADIVSTHCKATAKVEGAA